MAPEKTRDLPLISHEIGEIALQFFTARAVFSKSGFDAGSDLLLKTFFARQSHATEPIPNIGDLGCGYGAIGAFCAAQFPTSRVFSADINARAAQLCALNYAKNNLQNGFAWCGDGFSAVPDAFFGAILFNPPVRAGNATIAKLFGHCERTLRENGQLWVVLRTAQGAKSWAKKLEAQFGSCQTLQISAGYRVLLVSKR